MNKFLNDIKDIKSIEDMILKECNERLENTQNFSLEFNIHELDVLNTLVFIVYNHFIDRLNNNSLMNNKELDSFISYLGTAYNKLNNA